MHTIPTQKDISPYGDLDASQALTRFLGKDEEQALAMFREKGGWELYLEDLAWMGGYAFAYYLQAVIRYCHEELESREKITPLVHDLIELLKLRGIMDAASLQGALARLSPVMTRAREELEQGIADAESIPLQEFYELSWDQQRSIQRAKAEYADGLALLHQFQCS